MVQKPTCHKHHHSGNEHKPELQLTWLLISPVQVVNEDEGEGIHQEQEHHLKGEVLVEGLHKPQQQVSPRTQQNQNHHVCQFVFCGVWQQELELLLAEEVGEYSEGSHSVHQCYEHKHHCQYKVKLILEDKS